jgi:sporulation protein YlmC with PRC-barrel domain
MGDIKVFNSAGLNDSENTVTSLGEVVGRVKDLFLSKTEAQVIEEKVEVNTQNVTQVVEDAPVSLNTFKEIADNLDVNEFFAALED